MPNVRDYPPKIMKQNSGMRLPKQQKVSLPPMLQLEPS
jgi:hypothetical protein